MEQSTKISSALMTFSVQFIVINWSESYVILILCTKNTIKNQPFYFEKVPLERINNACNICCLFFHCKDRVLSCLFPSFSSQFVFHRRTTINGSPVSFKSIGFVVGRFDCSPIKCQLNIPTVFVLRQLVDLFSANAST